MRRSRRTGTSIGTILLVLVVIVVYELVRGGLGGGTPTPVSQNQAPGSTAAVVVPGQAPQWGKQVKTSGCQVNGMYPDPACTPGDVLPNVTADQVCKSGYAGSVRNVTDATKNQAYAEYGIKSHSAGEYEVDHFVSLELGGSNDISNLWPEAAKPTPGFHEKDKVENYLHDQVCSGKMSLKDAQVTIATNWHKVYDEMQTK